MSKSKKSRHFMDEVYGKIRKPMPKPGRVIENEKDHSKNLKWRYKDWGENEEKD